MTLVVHMRHVRAANLCARGGRAWFARHGLSWNDFLRDGIPASEVRSINDPLAERAIAEAEREARDEQR